MKNFLFLSLACSVSLYAAQETPWIERPLQLIPHIELRAEAFDHLDSKGKQISYHARNLFLDGSLYFAPSSGLSYEIGTTISKTKDHPYLIDSFHQAARYALYDDALGDPFAWTIGIEISEVFRRSLHDPSAFHRGLFEVELHTAQGIECPWDCDWSYRLYALEAIGMGHNAPWFRAFFATELESQTGHLFGAKLEGYLGFGDHALSLCHFSGYGPLAYRLIDASLYYRLRTDDWTLYEVGLLFRPYSRNVPYQKIALNASIFF